MDFRACPRCGADVLDSPADSEKAFCINCGWRAPDVPDDVTEQVKSHEGRRNIEDSYRRSNP